MNTAALYEIFNTSAGVTTDSRAVQHGHLFFALKGDSFNGNLFAAEALRKGALHVVVDELTDELKAEEASRYTLVPNVLQALQQLGLHHRQQLRCPVLAITGSNGKTTTKELVLAVLQKKFAAYATKGNLNNHIGIPLTLLSIPRQATFAIVEMGANHQGEIADYCSYTLPDYGLITNVGKAHLEGFGGEAGVVKGKTELYRFLMQRGGKVFVNNSSEKLQQALRDMQFPVSDCIAYGYEDAYCNGRPQLQGEFLAVETDEGRITTQLVGAYNFENVMSAICIGKYFGVQPDDIASAISSYSPGNHRSQKMMWRGHTVIMDAYNANPSSMQQALENFGALPAPRKVLVLGEMMELGSSSADEHRHMARLAHSLHCALNIFVGDGFLFLKDENWCHHFATAALAKNFLLQQLPAAATLLIKGSRRNQLEQIVQEG